MKNFTNLLSTIFLTTLWILALTQIFSSPTLWNTLSNLTGWIFWFDICEVAILSTIYSQISEITYALVILAIASGALLFYSNRDKIESIDSPREIPQGGSEAISQGSEQTQEELEEEKRKAEFGEKFPILSKIPVVGWIVKWMYKEGWKYSLGLVWVLILAFILRYLNLIIIDPYTDEYFHLLAGKELLDSWFTEYTRALIVSYSVAFFYWLWNANSFYEYLYWWRIPWIIFSTLTIIPLYFLTKKINKPVAIITIILWATSPWAIWVAKSIREYAFYPFFILIFVLLCIKFFENIFKGTINKTTIFSGWFVLSFLYYALKVDTLSTLKISLLIFLAILWFFIIQNYKKMFTFISKIKSNKIIISIFYIFLLWLFWYIIYYALWSSHVNFVLDFNKWYFNVFLDWTIWRPMHWWNWLEWYKYISYFLIFWAVLYSIYYKKHYLLLILMIFVILVFFYTFLFDRYYRPRYIFYVLPFFTILVSTWIYWFYSFVKHAIFKGWLYKKGISIAIISIFILSIIKPSNTLYPLISDDHWYVKTTNEHHDKITNLVNFLTYEIRENDFFITTVFSNLLYLWFDVDLSDIHHFRYTSSHRFNDAKEFISNTNSWLMILDWRRNWYWVKWYPKEDFEINSIKINMIYEKDGFNVYRWEH